MNTEILSMAVLLGLSLILNIVLGVLVFNLLTAEMGTTQQKTKPTAKEDPHENFLPVDRDVNENCSIDPYYNDEEENYPKDFIPPDINLESALGQKILGKIGDVEPKQLPGLINMNYRRLSTIKQQGLRNCKEEDIIWTALLGKIIYSNLSLSWVQELDTKVLFATIFAVNSILHYYKNPHDPKIAEAKKFLQSILSNPPHEGKCQISRIKPALKYFGDSFEFKHDIWVTHIHKSIVSKN